MGAELHITARIDALDCEAKSHNKLHKAFKKYKIWSYSLLILNIIGEKFFHVVYLS